MEATPHRTALIAVAATVSTPLLINQDSADRVFRWFRWEAAVINAVGTAHRKASRHCSHLPAAVCWSFVRLQRNLLSGGESRHGSVRCAWQQDSAQPHKKRSTCLAQPLNQTFVEQPPKSLWGSPRPAHPYDSGTKAQGRTRPEPTARRSDSFRPSAGSGPTPWPSRTPRNGTAGCLATWRSITGSESTRPSAGAHLSSGSSSCSADEPGGTTHLGRVRLPGLQPAVPIQPPSNPS